MTYRSSIPTQGGFSLLEIIVSLAILTFVLTTVGQIIYSGSQAATKTQLASKAMVRAQTVMAEVVAGIHPKQSLSDATFENDDDPAWTWSLNVTAGVLPDLLRLDVTVNHNDANGVLDESFTLTRWVRNDAIFLEVQDDTDL